MYFATLLFQYHCSELGLCSCFSCFALCYFSILVNWIYIFILLLFWFVLLCAFFAFDCFELQSIQGLYQYIIKQDVMSGVYMFRG